VLVIADKGAHVAGTATFGALALSASGTAGPGGRVTLKFTVPNNVAPPRGTHGTGTVRVVSSFRGAIVTRSATFDYGGR
jgi:hypothetical protein